MKYSVKLKSIEDGSKFGNCLNSPKKSIQRRTRSSDLIGFVDNNFAVVIALSRKLKKEIRKRIFNTEQRERYLISNLAGIYLTC